MVLLRKLGTIETHVMPGFVAFMSSKISRGQGELCVKAPVQGYPNLSFFQRGEIPGDIESSRETDHHVPNLIHPPLEHSTDSVHLQDGPQRLRNVSSVRFDATMTIPITYAVGHELRISVAHVDSSLVDTFHPNVTFYRC
jgi:hypothetical protein